MCVYVSASTTLGTIIVVQPRVFHHPWDTTILTLSREHPTQIKKETFIHCSL